MITELDCIGLLCPLPVLKALRGLKKLAPNDRLIIKADDPSAPADFKELAIQKNLNLDIKTDQAGITVFTISKDTTVKTEG